MHQSLLWYVNITCKGTTLVCLFYYYLTSYLSVPSNHRLAGNALVEDYHWTNNLNIYVSPLLQYSLMQHVL